MDYKILVLLICAVFKEAEVTPIQDPHGQLHNTNFLERDEPDDEDSSQTWPSQVVVPRAGMKLRITQHAFDYVSSVSMVLLAKELEGVVLPPILQKVGPMTVNITNINITENPPPKIAIIPLPGFGLRVTLSEMAPHLEADYKSIMDLGFFSIKKYGRMTVRSAEVKFDVDIMIGRDNNSRPTVEVADCHGSGLARVSFQGGWSEGLNAASTMFGKEIKSLLFAQICWRFRQDIGQNLTAVLQKAPVTYVIKNIFELDFGLVQFPYFDTFAMETAHKGVVYLLKDGERTIPPSEPPRLPAIESHNKSMLYIYISSYTLNSAGYAAFHSGLMAINVTKSMIPGNYGEYLQTTCPDRTCVGSIFPQLSSRHPNTEVTLQISAREAPRVDFRNGTIMVKAAVDVDIHVANDGRLLTINANLSTECKVAVKEGKLLFNFTEINPTTSVSYSVIPELKSSGFLLNGLARMATQQFLKPKLAEIGRRGIDLPSHKDISITNAQIIFDDNLPDVIVIAGDARYLGPMPTKMPDTEGA